MSKKTIWTLVTVAGILVAVLPLFSPDYVLHIGILILMYAYLSQSWNIVSGFSGQFSFGHAAYFGLGAYTSSILLTKYSISPWIGMFVGSLIAFLVAVIIGFLSFRSQLKGAYFALASLAFAEILRTIIQNLDYFNKTMGILIPLKIDPAMYQFSSRVPYYYVIFVMVILVTFFVYRISRSKLGYSLVAIRENEDAAKSLGVNAFRNKMVAIGLSGALTAFAGTFYAQYMLMIEPPTAFSPDVSISILLPAIVGGAGTVFGPLIGALITIPLGEITSNLFSNMPGMQFIIYGGILTLVILFIPEGVVGRLQDRKNKHDATTDFGVPFTGLQGGKVGDHVNPNR